MTQKKKLRQTTFQYGLIKKKENNDSGNKSKTINKKNTQEILSKQRSQDLTKKDSTTPPKETLKRKFSSKPLLEPTKQHKVKKESHSNLSTSTPSTPSTLSKPSAIKKKTVPSSPLNYKQQTLFSIKKSKPTFSTTETTPTTTTTTTTTAKVTSPTQTLSPTLSETSYLATTKPKSPSYLAKTTKVTSSQTTPNPSHPETTNEKSESETSIKKGPLPTWNFLNGHRQNFPDHQDQPKPSNLDKSNTTTKKQQMTKFNKEWKDDLIDDFIDEFSEDDEGDIGFYDNQGHYHKQSEFFSNHPTVNVNQDKNQKTSPSASLPTTKSIHPILKNNDILQTQQQQQQQQKQQFNNQNNNTTKNRILHQPKEKKSNNISSTTITTTTNTASFSAVTPTTNFKIEDEGGHYVQTLLKILGLDQNKQLSDKDYKTLLQTKRDYILKLLRVFDVNPEYGGCTGLSRMERYLRGQRFNKRNPPPSYIYDILRHSEPSDTEIQECVLYKQV